MFKEKNFEPGKENPMDYEENKAESLAQEYKELKKGSLNFEKLTRLTKRIEKLETSDLIEAFRNTTEEGRWFIGQELFKRPDLSREELESLFKKEENKDILWLMAPRLAKELFGTDTSALISLLEEKQGKKQETAE